MHELISGEAIFLKVMNLIHFILFAFVTLVEK